MILHQTQIVSAALLRRNWPSHFFALVCVEGGPHLLLCTPELLSFGGIPLRMRNQREESFTFLLFFLSINICCGFKDTCFSVKKAVGELSLAGEKMPPWRNCWGTMGSMDWLLLSKRVNVVVCLCMCATQKALSWRQPSQILISFNDPKILQAFIIHGLLFPHDLELAQNIIPSLFRKALEETRRAQISGQHRAP